MLLSAPGAVTIPYLMLLKTDEGEGMIHCIYAYVGALLGSVTPRREMLAVTRGFSAKLVGWALNRT